MVDITDHTVQTSMLISSLIKSLRKDLLMRYDSYTVNIKQLYWLHMHISDLFAYTNDMLMSMAAYLSLLFSSVLHCIVGVNSPLVCNVYGCMDHHFNGDFYEWIILLLVWPCIRPLILNFHPVLKFP